MKRDFVSCSNPDWLRSVSRPAVSDDWVFIAVNDDWVFALDRHATWLTV